MANTAPRATLIVSTYNWPEALARVLASALRQTERRFEIVVADDGSRPETAGAVAEALGSGDVPWRHVRQEDRGFRQSRVRNLGVRHARAPHLIFIDHDVLLHPGFVAEHLGAAAEGLVLVGKRCFLSAARTARLLKEGLGVGGRWWPAFWERGLENRKNAVHWPAVGRWLSRPRPFQTALRGCNLSVSRSDFLRVDGFDETFDGVWGREDSDFCYRLFHSGVRCRNLWFTALQAHLFHPTRRRTGRDALDEELDRNRAERRRMAVHGYSRLDAEGEVVAASPEWEG